MVRQWNRACHVPHQHGRMNLVVRMRCHFIFCQGNSQRLCLRRIDILHAGADPGIPVLALLTNRVGCSNTEHWANNTTTVCLNKNRVQQRIPSNRCMGMEPRTVLGCPHGIHQVEGLGGIRNQHTIHSDRCALVNLRHGDPRHTHSRSLGKEVENRRGRHMLRDRGQKRHRLHNTNRMTLRSLHRTHEAPGCAV